MEVDEASPVTGGATRVVDVLSPAVITDRYRSAGVDVSDYFEGLREVEVRQCRDTGYRYYTPLSVAGRADFYERLYNPAQENWADPDYREWGEDYQYAFDRIASGEQLLDVGCGYGYFLRRAVTRCRAQGLDGNPHAVRRCRELGLEVDEGRLGSKTEEWAGRFDTVCAFQVLEHVVDVRGLLHDMLEVLKPTGRLILAVPNNEPYIRRYDSYSTWNLPPHHIGLWDLDSLDRMARHFGMRITDHNYSETSGRYVVEAYLHARRMAGVTTEIHKHSLVDKMKMAALMR